MLSAIPNMNQSHDVLSVMVLNFSPVTEKKATLTFRGQVTVQQKGDLSLKDDAIAGRYYCNDCEFTLQLCLVDLVIETVLQL